MTNKRHKEVVLKASKEVLKEYKNNTHYNNINNCSLCNVFYNKFEENFSKCKHCPMKIFDFGCMEFGCMNRKCEPVTQRAIYRTIDIENLTFINRTKRVIEFYEKFIELVKKSRHCRVNTSSGNQSTFARKLLKLDNEIYLKYKKV